MERLFKLLAVCTLQLVATGCWHTRAHLTVLSPSSAGAGGVELLGDEVVTGKACGGGEREARAFDDALSKRPGTQLLTQAEIEDRGWCAHVIGRPARYASGAARVSMPTSSDRLHDGKVPPAGQAFVYFYRIDVGTSWRDAKFELRGVEPFELSDDGRQLLTLAPGSYGLTVTRGGDTFASPELKLEPGRVYYVKFADQSAGQSTASPYITTARTAFRVELRDPAFARAELANAAR